MGKKQQSYAAIKEWAGKRAADGDGAAKVAASLAAYEGLKREIKELGVKLEEKRAARAEALAALVGEYKTAKAALKKAETEARKAAKKAKKAEKSAAASS